MEDNNLGDYANIPWLEKAVDRQALSSYEALRDAIALGIMDKLARSLEMLLCEQQATNRKLDDLLTYGIRINK